QEQRSSMDEKSQREKDRERREERSSAIDWTMDADIPQAPRQLLKLASATRMWCESLARLASPNFMNEEAPLESTAPEPVVSATTS
ncbi:hypothetical protein PENTCL1PPCAC_4564, partial [Pristionchus entomophagus]